MELFSGWGIYAQNFEGQILKQVMLEGIRKDIVCLPVHDAVAVQQKKVMCSVGKQSFSYSKSPKSKFDCSFFAASSTDR